MNPSPRMLALAPATLVTLTGCGAEDVATPGNTGNVTINNTTNPPAAPPPSPPAGPVLVTPASGCPNLSPRSSTKIEPPMFEHKTEPLAPRHRFLMNYFASVAPRLTFTKASANFALTTNFIL